MSELKIPQIIDHVDRYIVLYTVHFIQKPAMLLIQRSYPHIITFSAY
uniref:Uncharacterized protein n=1 Tax=Anguilla anguilla TaxID=7936 RepID=A0A0E9RPV3_ANGAN